ncbi:hypothetical protein LTR95_012523, partial [Oleoguttula sp. CCFEE 5521]
MSAAAMDSGSADENLQDTPSGTKRKAESEKRTYRACLHCRQRKARCNLYGSGEPGKPPCERCIREQHECVLGSSHRGGRRVKRSHSEDTANGVAAPHISIAHEHSSDQSPSSHPATWATMHSHSQPQSQSQQHLAPEPGYASSDRTPHDDAVDDTVAATDLQNPSDALDFLAQVAERDAARSPGERPHEQKAGAGAHAHGHLPSQQPTIYPLLQSGQLSVEMVSTLLLRYHDKYHPYFPIANVDAMTPQRLWTTASDQKHLLTAMLTVASRDVQEWQQTHEACSAHMQDLIANLVYAGTGSVEAIEALLILSEWPPRQPRCPSIGRGEEDAAAWMLVGTAIRIGYLLGIDRTGFRTANDGNTDGLDRKRLAWAACYISDRQISVRLGKAFWSRGPGPMTALGTRDFPSLKPKQPWQDDYAAIFQANLDLTQLFSNAHDVLYATKDRSQQLHMGG